MESQIVGSVAYGLLCVFLLLAAVWDMRTEQIPNWLTYPAIVVGLLFWTVAEGIVHHAPLTGLSWSFWAFLAGIVPGAILFFAKGFGAGDAKMVGAIGAISASIDCLIQTVILGLLLTFLWAIVTMIRRGIVKQTLRRIFTAILMMAAKVEPDLETQTHRLAVAVPFAVAGIIVGAQTLLKIKLHA